jgi:hypothetical protein
MVARKLDLTYTFLKHMSGTIPMPRRKANVNQADVQRAIRAYQRESVPFKMTLQPNGAAVFEPAPVTAAEPNSLDQWRSERGQG